MFGVVTHRYGLSNDVVSLFQMRMRRWMTHTAITARLETRVLGLVAGTGTSPVEHAADGAGIVVCDFSTSMMARGRCYHPEITFATEGAMAPPFAGENSDVVTISYRSRNVQDAARALSEMRRAAVPDERIVAAEFSTPVWPAFRHLYRFYPDGALPAAIRLVSSNTEAYNYLGELIPVWPDQREPAGLMQQAG